MILLGSSKYRKKFASDNRNRDLLEKYEYREGRKFQKNRNLAVCLLLNKCLIRIPDYTCTRVCVYMLKDGNNKVLFFVKCWLPLVTLHAHATYEEHSFESDRGWMRPPILAARSTGVCPTFTVNLSSFGNLVVLSCFCLWFC